MIKKLFALILIILICLVFLEFTVQIFAPQDISPVIGELDPILGYKLKANVSAVHKTSEFDTVVYTNAEGYRSSQINYEKENKVRIMFLGDSFTYGWGVNAEERFSDIVAKNLDIEMLNAGVPGYKLSNILAYYETEGYKYHPDIVVLAYNLRTGIVNINSLEYQVENGTLVKTPLYAATEKNSLKKLFSHIPFYSFLSQHSHLFALFRNVVVGILQQRQVHETFTECAAMEQLWYSQNKEREVLIVQELNNIITQQNSSLILVLLPVTSCNATDLLTDFKTATNVTFIIDLTPILANNTAAYYYVYDKHWNQDGHLLAAKILTSYITMTFSPGDSY